MKRMFRLIRLEFSSQAIGLLSVLALMAALEGLLFWLRLGSAGDYAPAGFDRIVDGSGIALVFLAALAAMVGLQVWGLMRGFAPTKSVYALLTLPVRRRMTYLSKLLVGCLQMLCLWSLQWLLVVWFHGAFAQKFDVVGMARGSLYLSCVRATFLSAVCPPDLVGASEVLAALWAVSSLALAVPVNLRARRWMVSCALLLAVVVLTRYMIPPLGSSLGYGVFYLTLAVALICGGALAGIAPLEEGVVSV